LTGTVDRTAVAHGEHEQRIGQQDADWQDWYAEYILQQAAS
jgi:hypothetical protein